MPPATAPEFNTVSLLTGLLGGLAIFLFGMEQMTATLRVLAGDRMKSLLGSLTKNRFTGVLAGTFVTSVLQSSSVTTVLLVGFVSAGIMTLQQSVGVIMGAEIGTTITAQIIAFQVSEAALAIVAAGFALQFLAGRDRLRKYGTMILGFGLLFFGMNIMSEATAPLRNFQPFIDTMKQMDNPILAIAFSALFTALIQSSSATTVLVIVLADQQVLSLERAIPIIFGANIGTCITALLAAIGKPRVAVRTAAVHVLFNCLGVAGWFFFIDQLAGISRSFTSAVPRQIAHSHTVFNVTNTFVLIWFATPISRFVTFLIPDRPPRTSVAAKSVRLDEILLRTPTMALEAVRMELGHLGLQTLHMVRGSFSTAVRGGWDDLSKLAAMDDNVDTMHAAIVTYLSQLSRENLTPQQSQRLHDYLLAANYFENIGDIIESNLVNTARHRLAEGLSISNATEQMMLAVHEKVCDAIEHAVRAVTSKDPQLARQVTEAKDSINNLIALAEDHLVRRLSAGEPKRLAAFRLESEIMEYLKRMFYFARRIAKLVEQETPRISPSVSGEKTQDAAES